MSSNESTSPGTILLALLGGAALGAGLALLYAPQSGRRTRQKIRDLGEDAEDTAREIYARAGEAAEEAMKKGGEWVRKGEDFVADAKRQVAAATDGSRSAR